MHASAKPSFGLEDELEALRRELADAVPIREEATASEASPGAEIEHVLRDLQARLEEAAGDAEEMVAAHPFASVAVAFLLGVLVANFMSRER